MTVQNQHPAPAFDPELAQLLAERAMPATMELDVMIRNRSLPQPVTIDDLVAARGIGYEDRVIPGPEGSPDITVSVFRKPSHAPGGPGFYYVHGGGMVTGDRFTGIERVLDWVEAFDAVAVSVEYRLAPEHPDPAPHHDCWAALAWTAAHAGELGFDRTRLVVVGASAGGGLAAGVVLRARDEGSLAVTAQVLIGPMLDDRNDSVSSQQIDGIGLWDRRSNEAGWTALLGERRGTSSVSAYAAPARATDLTGLPPTYIDCGSAEVFRDESVAFASAIWAAGGTAELHVWAGGHHGFDLIFPSAAISVAARRTCTEFLRRLLG